MKSSLSCHSEYGKKNTFFQKLSANILQHMKKIYYCKNLKNLSKPCRKSLKFVSLFFSLWLQSFQNAITRFCCAISGRGLEIQAVDLFKSPVLGQLFDSNLNWKMQLNFEFWTRVSFVQFATNLNSGKKTTLLQIFITSEDKSRKLHFKSTFKLDFFAPTL